MSRNSLLKAGAKSEGEVSATGLEPRTTQFLNEELSCVLSTYLYGAFDCMFLSCHVRVLVISRTVWPNG